ncbi:hypothetical protein L1274_002018 [Duganella sp. HSC-15S17]|uniref:Uncharacterized protein n=1 Tax=Duganella violaceipulchra TaxID=2849652 RepID=A0ABT1GH75_9BURK|nr:hypothetical protein [Duganella violaceicalia]
MSLLSTTCEKYIHADILPLPYDKQMTEQRGEAAPI